MRGGRAAALLALGLAGSLLAQSPDGAAAADPAAARLEWRGTIGELHRQLAEPLRASRKDFARGQELLARLVAPGPRAIAPLLDMLVQGRVPRAQPDDAPQLLSIPQRELLLSALARLPADALRVEIERRIPRPPEKADPDVQLAALRVLSVIGTRADLHGLAALAPREKDEIGPDAAEALRAAYAGILRRDPAALSGGLNLLQSLDPGPGKQLLFALGDLGDKRALPMLDVCARTIPALAQQAAALVPLVGPSGDPDLDQPLAAWLGDRIDPERPEWTRACLLAIGVLDNGSQVPVLLEQLESAHPGLRQAALGALRSVSGLGMGDSKAAWREWYARETEWQERGRQLARTALGSGQDVLVARALDAYGDHRLFREELAEDVLDVLGHGSPPMRVLACDTLARIGSKRALGELVELISDADAALADASWRASCALSGQTLPRTAQEAREQLGR